MNNDPGIICFRHCSTRNVFCKRVPATCPVCSSQMQNFVMDPFRVPYPFKYAVHCPISIAIRPSEGSFFDYDITRDDLHIGIVDSYGWIVEFDRDGLIMNNFASWAECVALEVVPEAWITQWDETLLSMSHKWKYINYNAISMNCFDFVLDFFNELGYVDLKFASKGDLCERLIVSKMRNVNRYVSLYKALQDREYVLKDY